MNCKRFSPERLWRFVPEQFRSGFHQRFREVMPKEKLHRIKVFITLMYIFSSILFFITLFYFAVQLLTHFRGPHRVLGEQGNMAIYLNSRRFAPKPFPPLVILPPRISSLVVSPLVVPPPPPPPPPPSRLVPLVVSPTFHCKLIFTVELLLEMRRGKYLSPFTSA